MAIYNNVEFEKWYEERLEQQRLDWLAKHKGWVHIVHGSTYVGFDIYDSETHFMLERIKNLVVFMGEQYVTFGPWAGIDGDKDSHYIVIPGDDKERADFIQKFIDNDYKLDWRKKEVGDDIRRNF